MAEEEYVVEGVSVLVVHIDKDAMSRTLKCWTRRLRRWCRRGTRRRGREEEEEDELDQGREEKAEFV